VARKRDRGWMDSDILSKIAISRAISDVKSGVSAGRLVLVLMARRTRSKSFGERRPDPGRA
jgi:hypothetical protein